MTRDSVDAVHTGQPPVTEIRVEKVVAWIWRSKRKKLSTGLVQKLGSVAIHIFETERNMNLSYTFLSYLQVCPPFREEKPLLPPFSIHNSFHQHSSNPSLSGFWGHRNSLGAQYSISGVTIRWWIREINKPLPYRAL